MSQKPFKTTSEDVGDQIPVVMYVRELHGELKPLEYYIEKYNDLYNHNDIMFEMLYKHKGDITSEHIVEIRERSRERINEAFMLRVEDMRNLLMRLNAETEIDKANGINPLTNEQHYYNLYPELRDNFRHAYVTFLSGGTNMSLDEFIDTITDEHAHTEDNKTEYKSLLGLMNDIKLYKEHEGIDAKSELTNDQPFVDAMIIKYPALQGDSTKRYFDIAMKLGDDMSTGPMVYEFMLNMRVLFGLLTPQEATDLMTYYIGEHYEPSVQKNKNV